MELYQLKSFLIVAREQNLTRAAETLHLSQSALSTQIKQLEEEFELCLFERTSRGMNLTEQGRRLLVFAQDVLDAADTMQQQALALARGSTTSVAIGLNTDPTFLRVSAINQRYSQLYASTNVIFHICQSIDTAQRLRHGQIDLGFFYGENREPDIEHAVISQVRTCVVVPTRLQVDAQSLSWTEIAALPWVWVENLPFFGVLQQSLADYRTQPNKAVTAVDEQIVRELVVAGQGVAIMREDEARPLVEAGQVVIWNKGWGEIPLCLGWLARNREEPHLQAALEVVRYIWRKPISERDGSMSDKCWV